MNDELHVPERSIEGVGMLACATLPNAEEWARAIAAPIVAAELRRIANWYTKSSTLGGDAYLAVAGELRRRASTIERGRS